MYYYNGQQQYQTIPQQNVNQQIGLRGRPVSSLEEVRAAQIDFDGSLFIFPDIANKKIYTKQINIDGTANLKMYELTAIPQTDMVNKDYITREEFESAFSELKESLSKEKEREKPVINANF